MLRQQMHSSQALPLLRQMLCPPGNGVHTVNTAKEKKSSLHQSLFDTDDASLVLELHNNALENFLREDNASTLAMIGICSDCGGGIQRGANWGPLFIRERLQRGRFAKKYTDVGDVRVIPHLLHDKYINQTTIEKCQAALYDNNQQLPVSPLSIAETSLDLLYASKPNLKLFGIGGDHSVSYPLVKSYLQHKKSQGIRCGLIHFDAHTDLLHSRLGIDLCFGSWLTHVINDFESPSHIAQLGIRSTAKSKSHWQDTFGIKQYWADEINKNSIEAYCEKIIADFQEAEIDEIYISFDIDALDANVASATGTPEPNGLSLERCLIAINLFGAAFQISGADLVEVAPLVNPNFKSNEPENTLLASKRLIEAMLTFMKV